MSKRRRKSRRSSGCLLVTLVTLPLKLIGFFCVYLPSQIITALFNELQSGSVTSLVMSLARFVEWVLNGMLWLIWLPLGFVLDRLFFRQASPTSAAVAVRSHPPIIRNRTLRSVGTSNPEERVRQYVLTLVRDQLGYRQRDIGVEFPIQMGSNRKRLDVVVFEPDAEHTQGNIQIIIECKRVKVRSSDSAIDQLMSYLAACPNAQYGAVATWEWLSFHKVIRNGHVEHRQCSTFPDAYGDFVSIDYDPPSETQEIRQDEIEADDDTREMLSSRRLITSGTNWSSWPSPTRKVWATVLGIAIVFMIWRTSVPPSYFRANVSAPPTAASIVQAARPTQALAAKPVTWTATPTLTKTPTATPTATLLPSATPSPALIASATRRPLPTRAAPTIEPTSLPTVRVVSSQNINVRSDAGVESPVITTLPRNEVVTVLEVNADETWLLIRTDKGIEGWVWAELTDWNN